MNKTWPKLLLCLALACSSTAHAELKIGTWNTLRLGHDNGKDMQAMATVVGLADLVALQEVMDPAAIDKLEAAVEARTGESWSSLMSHAIGRGSYKELYAFMWRDSKIAYTDGAVVYLDRGDRFEREPFSAGFLEKSTGQQFAVATAHILYGKSESQRTPEIRALADYWTWLHEVYDRTSAIFLVGDFNLPPGNPAWKPLQAQATHLIKSGGSTLSSRDGVFKSLFDNVLVGPGAASSVSKAYVLNYPKMLKLTHATARATVSDHAPIFVHVDFQRTQAAGQPPFQGSPQQTTPPAIAMSAGVRGNSKSMVYHRPDCPSYNAISDRNSVEFSTTEAAIEAGYRLAGNCPNLAR